MLLLHHPGIGRQGGIRTHRRLFLRQPGLPVSFTCRYGEPGWICTTGVSYVADLQSAGFATGLLTHLAPV